MTVRLEVLCCTATEHPPLGAIRGEAGVAFQFPFLIPTGYCYSSHRQESWRLTVCVLSAVQ